MDSVGYPDITTNKRGIVAIAFSAEDGNGIHQIHFRYSSTYGASWPATTIITNDHNHCLNPAISIDEQNRVVIVYEVLVNGIMPQLYETHYF